jgi:glycosyltransferase involved in cell wall biosynthesis
MRIMMLTQFYPPIIGGEEHHVRSLSCALAMRGHTIIVVTLWHRGMLDYEEDDHIRIYRVRAMTQHLPWIFSDENRHHAPPWADPAITHHIADILAREKPEIVHAHNWLVYAFLPLKKQSKAKLVLTLHDYSLVCVKKNMMQFADRECAGPKLQKCLNCASKHYGRIKGYPVTLAHWRTRADALKLVDIFLPVSHAVAEKNQLVGSNYPYQIIPNFIPDELAEQDMEESQYLNSLPDKDFILYVGDLSRQKGIEILLQAYASLQNAPPLMLIGRPFVDTPTELPPGVTIAYSWPHSAVLGAWKRCLFGVIPSIWPDPCPTVALEAMVMGKAVIASRIGGLLDIVDDNKTGLLVSPNDVASLSSALQNFFQHTENYQQMGQIAAQRVVQFQAATIVPKIEDVYTK